MKKKYAIFTVIIFILLVTTFTYFNTLKQNNIYKENIENNQTKITKGISMNLEQTAGAGDYKTVTQSGWPTEGYKFNTELSRCENGSELSWDDTNKKVIVSGNTSDKCYIYFDIYQPTQPTLTEYIKSQYTGTQGENSLYYHNSTLTNGAGDNSYRYAGGDYVLTEAGKATGATMVIGYDDTITTALIDFYCNGTKKSVGYYCDSSQTHYYLIKGDTTHYQSYNEALNVSVEKGYLTKDNVKNFVCFGSDASPCPESNLFRILGVFGDETKVIRAKSVRDQKWHTSESNKWSSSSLNTYLNGEYLTSLGILKNKIATTTWKVGGGTSANISQSVPKTAYQYEIITPDKGQYGTEDTCDAQIGLMYASDYYYSASPSAWTLVGYNSRFATKDYRAAKTINWLYLGSYEWTISRNSDGMNGAFIVIDTGRVDDYLVTISYGVRPSFNLESSITYVSGDGTQSSPIRIN